MAESQCVGCGRRFYKRTGTHEYCTPACRERHKARDPARRRRYSSPHQQLRAQVAVAVERGDAVCARCGEPIRPGEPWDLDHAEGNGNGYLGPSHSSCNRAAPRIRENGLVWSRRWFEDAREGTIVAGKEIRHGGRWVPLEGGLAG
jgi:hypothetical protein